MTKMKTAQIVILHFCICHEVYALQLTDCRCWAPNAHCCSCRQQIDCKYNADLHKAHKQKMKATIGAGHACLKYLSNSLVIVVCQRLHLLDRLGVGLGVLFKVPA